MANEFVARRGIIAQSGGAKITGSLLVSGAVNATGYTVTADEFVGAISTANTASYVEWNNVDAKPSNLVSSSTQVKTFLPGGTVSSSAQYPGWVTASSQIDYNSITNKLSGVISSSTQFNALVGTSASFATTASAATSITFTPATSSFALTASYVPGAASDWDSVANKPANLVSSSTQVKAFLPDGTVSASAQYPGWVTASSQIDITSTTGYTTFSSSLSAVDAGQNIRIDDLASKTGSYAIDATIQGQLAGVVSSSTQVKPLLPDGTVSSSTQYPGWVTASSQIALSGVTGTTFATANFTFPQNLNVGGTLTAREIQTEYVTSSIIYESGSTKFGDTADDTHQFTGSLSVLGTISGALVLPAGTVTASSQIDYNLIQNKLSGVVSSSAQVAPLLPDGTVSSSTQVTSLLPAGTVSSSGQVTITATTGYSTFSSSIATKNDIQDISISSLNAATGSYAIDATIQGQLAGVVSSSTQVKPLLPGGTVSSSAQYPGWVTASSQVVLSSITGTTFATSDFTFPQKLTVSGVLSGSTSAFINNSLYSGSAVTGIVGPVNNQVVATLPTANYDGVFFDYVVKDGTNYRTGTVMVVANGTNVEFTDTSTADIGNTAQVSFAVDIVGGFIRLKFTNISGTWSFKTVIRAL